MEFKSSASVYATGFVLSLFGSIFGGIFTMVTASTYGSSAMGPGILAFLSFLTAVVGSIMTVVGMYRALVKIDALPVPAVPQAPTQTPVQH